MLPHDLRTEPSGTPAPLVAIPKESKLLAKMKANPRGDWQISDLATVAGQVGLTCTAPTRGSHFKFSSTILDGGILPIPHRKPVKVNYVKDFLRLVEAHQQASNPNGTNQ
jgi:hypothetical protein